MITLFNSPSANPDGRSADSQALSFENAVRRVRNILRPFNGRSIVELVLASLQKFEREGGIDAVRSMPWITLLLVKLVLEDRMIHMNAGSACPMTVLDQCKHLLWRAQDKERLHNGDRPFNAYLMVRSLVQVQMDFQNGYSLDFLRWPALIGDLPSHHPTRQQFITLFQMEPEEFCCLCFAVYSAVLTENGAFSEGYFAALRPFFGDLVDRFLSLFGRSVLQLRDELQSELALRVKCSQARNPSEVFEFSWLQRYPLLKLTDSHFVPWHRTLFARSMEQSVHSRMTDLGEEYTQPFSLIFESYVMEVLASMGVEYLAEKPYKAVASEQCFHPFDCRV